MSEQMTTALFIDFDLILYVAIERFEHFDDRNCETIFVEVVWFRDVAKRINETNETNEHLIDDFSLILHVNSDVENRKSKLFVDFRAWCWRICSWNLLLKLKLCLQRLQIRAQTICWIENFFIDFDANSSVDFWKIVRSISSFTRMRTVWVRILAINFAKISTVFAISVIESDVISTFFDVISNVVIEKCKSLSETNCKNTFVFVTKFLDVAKRIDDFCDENEHVIDAFFAISLVKLTVLFEKNEQMSKDFWTEISWNSDSNVWNDDFDEIKKHWIDSFFFDFRTVSGAIYEKCEFLSEMTVSKIIVNSNFCFDVAIETCSSDETKEKIFVKTISKSCKKMKFDWFSNQMSTKSQRITFIHSSNSDSQHKCWHCWKCWMKMMIWLNRLFSKFWWDRFELKIPKDASKSNSKNVKNSNNCIANEAKNDELIVDILIDSHVDLVALIKKCELTTNLFACCSRLCWRNIFLKLNVFVQCRHIDNLFVDSDVISSAKDWKVDYFNKVTVSNATADSNIDFWDFASEANDTCVTNDFFLISHIKLIALIEKWEFLTNFRASWLRICSYNSLLKLKLCLQILQFFWTICWFDAFSLDFDITSNVLNWKFEFLETRRTDAFENVFAKILSKRFNEINSNWILNHSNAKSHRHFDNKANRFDLRYKCLHCSKCCRKFVTLLYCSKFDSLQTEKSNVSIFWNLDVFFVVSMISNSARFVAFRTLRFARFWIIDFNFRCSCEENAFVKIISKRDIELKCDCFLNHFQTKSLRIQSMYSSNFVLRYRYNSWQCSRFRRKLVTSLNNLISKSRHVKLELNWSISRKELKKSKFEDKKDIEDIAKIEEKNWLTK